ncbi:MAG: D-alanyl-D-alanine endopeptidase [Burkholderiales bacterium]
MKNLLRYLTLFAALTALTSVDASASGHHKRVHRVSYDAVASPGVSALSVLVLDQKDGLPLYQKNANMETPIASISKLMTAMVVLDAHPNMDETLTVTQADVDMLRHSSSRLAVGTELTRGELLHLALIASENRAAYALARNYPGGMPSFIAAMNAKARQLGMEHTSFEDPTGLSSHNQSTAADLAKMVQAAIRYPVIHQITTTANYEVTRTTVARMRGKHKNRLRTITQTVEFHNTNQLLRDESWNIGLSKTGFINEAGHCLVMQAKIAQKPVIIVLLDASGKYGRINDARRIRSWLERHPDSNKLAAHMQPIASN